MNKKPQELATSVRKGARRAVYNAAIKLAKAMFVQRHFEKECWQLQFIMMPDAYGELVHIATKHKIQLPTGFWQHWHNNSFSTTWSSLTYEQQLIGILFYAEMVLTGDLDNIDGKLNFN